MEAFDNLFAPVLVEANLDLLILFFSNLKLIAVQFLPQSIFSLLPYATFT